MIKRPKASDFEYRYLVVDIAGKSLTWQAIKASQALTSLGHPRIYLENADAKPERSTRPDRKFLGVRWS